RRADKGLGWVGTGVNPHPMDAKEGLIPPKPEAVAIGEQQIASLEPQLNRMYVDPGVLVAFLEGGPEAHPKAAKLLERLKQEVADAAKSGKVDLCLWSLPKGHETTPAEMTELAGRYARLVKELIDTTPGAKPSTFIVSAQNEPNRTKLSPQQ